MKPTKIRYTLRNGVYRRNKISNSYTFLSKFLANALPEFARVDDMPTTLIKTLGSMNVVIYKLNTRYYDRYGVPGIVEVVIG